MQIGATATRWLVELILISGRDFEQNRLILLALNWGKLTLGFALR